MTTVRRLKDEDVETVFKCVHLNLPPPPHLRFQIVAVGPGGQKLSPPELQFEDGLYILLKPQKKRKPHDAPIPPKIPPSLTEYVMKDVPQKHCKWSLSGPQFPQPTAIQQRYCYPIGTDVYSSNKGGALWTMFREDGKEDTEFRLLHVYYSAKRAGNLGPGTGVNHSNKMRRLMTPTRRNSKSPRKAKTPNSSRRRAGAAATTATVPLYATTTSTTTSSPRRARRAIAPPRISSPITTTTMMMMSSSTTTNSEQQEQHSHDDDDDDGVVGGGSCNLSFDMSTASPLKVESLPTSPVACFSSPSLRDDEDHHHHVDDDDDDDDNNHEENNRSFIFKKKKFDPLEDDDNNNNNNNNNANNANNNNNNHNTSNRNHPFYHQRDAIVTFRNNNNNNNNNNSNNQHYNNSQNGGSNHARSVTLDGSSSLNRKNSSVSGAGGGAGGEIMDPFPLDSPLLSFDWDEQIFKNLRPGVGIESSADRVRQFTVKLETIHENIKDRILSASKSEQGPLLSIVANWAKSIAQAPLSDSNERIKAV